MDYDLTRVALYHPERQPPLFDGDDPRWSEAACAAELARLAYFKFETDQRAALEAGLAAMGLTQLTTFNNPGADAQAFGATAADGGRWLAFRGTQSDSLRDLIVDARFRLTAWQGPGQVHSGFAETLAVLLPAIEAWLAQAPAAPLTLTGHSLGGALATLMAALAPGARLFSFGAPKVGDGAFVAALAGRDIARYVDCADIVPTVPPGRYVHPQGLRYIFMNGDVAATPPGAMTMRSDQWLASFTYGLRHGFTPGNVLVRNLADHAPINYIAALLGGRRGP